MEVLKNAGAATVTAVGLAASPTLTATVSNGDDATTAWLTHTTGSGNGNASGVISATFTILQSSWSPQYYTNVKSGATITNIRYWVGLFSASPDSSAAPAATSLVAFRFDTSVPDTNWQFCTSNSGLHRHRGRRRRQHDLQLFDRLLGDLKLYRHRQRHVEDE
jgi:hypothetical protein